MQTFLPDHYAVRPVVDHDYERFYREELANRRALGYPPRFIRLWDFYLTGCELAFRVGAQMVFQIQLTKRKDTVPFQRDYITDWERDHLATRSRAAQ